MLRKSLIITNIKKTLTIGFLATTLIVRSGFPVFADDTQPSEPTAPSTPSTPSQPSQSQPSDPPSSPSIPSEPQQNVSTMTEDQRKAAAQQYIQEQNQKGTSPSPTQTTTNNNAQPSTTPTATTTSNDHPTNSGNVGNTTVSTGEGNNHAAAATIGNTNSTVQPTGSTTSASITPTPSATVVSNVGNGTGSDNNATVQSANNNNTKQNNDGTAVNNLNLSSATGQNNASLNVGNSNLQTGNANVSGTAMTFMNTNVDGIAVNEFNVADNHTGDIVLDFASHCISGCGIDAANVVKNIANGRDSTNNANNNQDTSNTTSQSNHATVGNTLTLNADSGHNSANDNTSGTSTIQTGNANVEANSLTLTNNNIDGRIVYSTVNIYGDLNGDIVMPQAAMDAVPVVNGSDAANMGNGTGSTNNSQANKTSNDATFQSNDANIANNIHSSTNTGNNSENNDTSGNANIQTGQNTSDSKIVNVANSNVDGGNVWLVIVNEAGKWIGKILGAPDGAHTASSGVTLSADNSGNVTASNGENGAGSTNNASSNQNTNNTATQTNNANVTNTLNLSANTGANSASDNTGGTSSIKTGDAHIIANLVNFVNNNIKNGGKLFVTVVNVFGKWIGNFVPPGQKEISTNSQPSHQASAQAVILPIPTQTVQTAAVNAVETNYIPASYSTQYYRYNPAMRYRYYPTANLQTNTKTRNNILATLPNYQMPLPSKTNVVAGVRTEANVVNINLAWLIPFLPFFVAIPLFKRKFLNSK